jgi:adenylylsulfate kinase
MNETINRKGMVLWFCGLSGSGKTTIANALKEELLKRGKKVSILDGDAIRDSLHRHLGFTPDDIRLNNRLISELCEKHVEDHDFVLVPIISPFRSSRAEAKAKLKDRFLEVYINSSLSTCITRDVKGLYKKALNGEIPNFIGLSKEVPFEPPLFPDVEIKTEGAEIKESVDILISHMTSKELL